MAKAKSKAEFIAAWKGEAAIFFRLGTRVPDLELQREFAMHFDRGCELVERLADTLEAEGTWEEGK